MYKHPLIYSFFFIVFVFSFDFNKSQAEPWLATRFAQNCAGCHAPGRYNRPLKDRRCTLSCQGCHVNPNGGGLRNQYGKWNSDRWLRSYNWKMQGKPKEKPLPWFAQPYTSEKQAMAVARALGGAKGTSNKKAKGKKGSKDDDKSSSSHMDFGGLHPKTVPSSKVDRERLISGIKATKQIRGQKSRFVNTENEFPNFDFSEFYYERANGDNNWEPEANLKKYESTIPVNDPYFQKKRDEVHVGLDFRFMGRNPIDNDNAEQAFWPMGLDVGLQWKPFIRKYDNISLVIETRYQNGPTTKDLDYATTSSVTNRSTYVLIDDLMYNFFVMYGIYKPMFEHYTPDHTSLAQNILYNRRGYAVLNKAFSIGTAPNVPFFNFHIIQPMANSQSFSQEEGFIANLGARWVTLGASIVASYRSTNDKSTVDALNTQAVSVNGGITWKNFIVNAEALNITKEFAKGSADSGTIFTTEIRYKVWKELYAEFVSEVSNVTAGGFSQTVGSMKEGDANQVTMGFRFFPVAGMNYSLHYRTTNNKPKNDTDYKSSEALIQAHLYF